MKEVFNLFVPRKRRVARFGKYGSLPAEILYTHPDGRKLVSCGGQRFSVFGDELLTMPKPIHGSPQNYSFDNEGRLR